MRDTVWPARPAADRAPSDSQEQDQAPSNTLGRIKLALLDAYAFDGESRGYDPYNTHGMDSASLAWQRKPKRS